MPYDRKAFFDGVRKDLFRGSLTQAQVDGMNYLLAVWERHFEEPNPRDGTNWLAYALATFFHETAERMEPIEEYGKGSGKSYGQKVAPHNQAYYGRGFVQLTWSENYQKGEKFLKDRYGIDSKIWPEPHRMLQHETSALVSYDGMIWGWFTGKKLGDYFNGTTNDPVNARRIVNGTDQAQKIAEHHKRFLASLRKVPKAETPAEVEEELPGLPDAPAMPNPGDVVEGEITRRDERRERQDERRDDHPRTARQSRRQDRRRKLQALNVPFSPPPVLKSLDYPVLLTIAFAVLFTGILLVIAKNFDPSGGGLTISLLVVLAFIAMVIYCLLYTIPNDEITSAAAGGLVASFGAIVAYWLGRK